MEWLNQIISNPIFALISFIVGLIGTILAFFSIKMEKKFKRLAYTTRSFNLLLDYSKKISNIEILYAGKRIKNLRVSRVAFWNSGTETLSRGDLADGDPLRIVVPQGNEFLDVKIIGSTNQANRIELERGNGACKISFEFLNKGDGAVIQITQTGWSFKFLGQIIGGGIPVFQNVEKYVYKPNSPFLIQITRKLSRRINLVLEKLKELTSALVGIAIGAFQIYSYLTESNLLYLIGGIFFCGVGLFVLYVTLTTKSAEVPGGLEIIDEEI